MKDVYIIILVATATLFTLATADDQLENAVPEGKLISTFQIVRFPNDACTGSATRNGTCYTSAECSDKGGSSSGSCADGFGVCCVFVVNACGQVASENITYWDAPATVPSGECNLMINPISDNICQLRLDFTTFVITGPSTSTEYEQNSFAGVLAGGTVNPAAIGAANANSMIGTSDINDSNWATNCLTDSFSVSSPNRANHPPTLCGIITGTHMYVDMEQDFTNTLSFIFQSKAGPATGIANTRGVTTLATRDWDITILQYECGYVNSAPPGCTQYYWSDTGLQVGGKMKSYNFQAAGSKHLANQDQRICIRRERTICWAGFYHDTANGKFDISGRTDAGALITAVYTASGMPCGYVGGAEVATGQSDADGALSYDCIIIPGAFAIAEHNDGIRLNPVTAASVRTPNTLTTHHSPFPPQMGSGGTFGGHANVDGKAIYFGANIGASDNTAYTVYTQHAPFTLIFKSDGIEGQGSDQESKIATSGIGFDLLYDLIPCTA